LFSLFFAMIHAWNHQFEPMPDGHVVRLNDLQLLPQHSAHIKRESNSLILSARGETRHATFDLPLGTTSSHLFVRVSAQAKQLIAGDEIWQDGRTFIEWLTPENQRGTVSPIHSAQGDSGLTTCFAIKIPPGDLRPILRLENLGKQGDYILKEIELTPASITGSWKLGSRLIMAAFVFLIASLLAANQIPSLPRRLFAASITCIVGYFFIIPGPWPQTKGLGQDLAWHHQQAKPMETDSGIKLYPPIAPQETIESKPADQKIPDTQTNYTKLPESDNLALQAKRILAKVRSLLHFALLFAPVWIVSYAVGSKRGFLLGIAMALGIEMAQWLFGYGFQADDVKDLLADLCGISMAVYCHTRLSRKIHSWMPFPFPQPA
jgi:hypothetical protein